MNGRDELPKNELLEKLISGPLAVPFWPDAGEALGYGRTAAYRALKTSVQRGESAEGAFAVPVLKRGQRYLVRRSDLLRYLGVEDPIVAAREGLGRAG